jgi:hypothetical protein
MTENKHVCIKYIEVPAGNISSQFLIERPKFNIKKSEKPSRDWKATVSKRKSQNLKPR